MSVRKESERNEDYPALSGARGELLFIDPLPGEPAPIYRGAGYGFIKV